MHQLVPLTVATFFATAVNAQVEFVKRSDLWAHEPGRSIGQGASAYQEFQ